MNKSALISGLMGEKEIVDIVAPIVTKLSDKVLTRAVRTFEINGMKDGVLFESCFIAMIYGDVGELDMLDFGHDMYAEVAHRAHLSKHDVKQLSNCHYIAPHILFTLCASRIKE